MIRTTADLASACERCKAEGILALDTEFVWKQTYRPRLGLVQFGCRTKCWALDCLTGAHTDALGSLLADDSVVKILHDARQDLVHLKHYTGANPVNVFDTQLAAAFAGFPAALGLQKLLFEAIDVGLAKTETMTDWMQRPLTSAQLKYALDDVRYLPALRDELLRRTEDLGTRAWLEEDLSKYDNPSLWGDYAPEEVWTRVKTGRFRLDRRGCAILRAVAALREEMAREHNLPRNWMGDDESLSEMAAHRRIVKLRHKLNGGLAEIARVRYEKAIAAAMEIPEDECPENPHRRYIMEVQEAADNAIAWLRVRAEQIHVDPAAIASKAVVTAYVDNVDDDSNPLANGWRYVAVGCEMAELFGVD